LAVISPLVPILIVSLTWLVLTVISKALGFLQHPAVCHVVAVLLTAWVVIPFFTQRPVLE
jgi:hypothetical protein